MKIYMFNHWVQDRNEQFETLFDQSKFLASFINPEAFQKMFSGSNVSSSDEDFEAAFEMVKNAPRAEEVKPRRRRRKVNNNG